MNTTEWEGLRTFRHQVYMSSPLKLLCANGTLLRVSGGEGNDQFNEGHSARRGLHCERYLFIYRHTKPQVL